MNWLFQTALYWTVFLGLYRWLLQRDTFHTANRLYLVSTLIVGMLLPLLPTDWLFSAHQSANLGGYFVLLPTLTVASVEAESWQYPSWSQLAFGAYCLISLGVFARFLATLYRLAKLQRHKDALQIGAVRLVEDAAIDAPFSFWQTVFLPIGHDWAERERQAILTHEAAHVRQWHSLDLLFIEVLNVGFWWAPPLFWYKTVLCDVHEFLADEAALRESDRKWYGSLLLKHANTHRHHTTFVHSFIRSQLQKRIVMMTKPTSSALAKWKFAAALPAAFCLLLALPRVQAQDAPPPPPPTSGTDAVAPIATIPPISATDVAPPAPPAPPAPLQKAKKAPKAGMIAPPPPPPPPPPVQHHSSTQSVADTLEPVLSMSEVLPEFEGGMEALFKYLGDNIKYPKAARKAKAEGTIYLGFVVEKDGSLSAFEVKKGVTAAKGNLLEEEAMRVVKSMPNWKPGTQDGKPVRVSYTLPIKFKLS